MHKDNNYVRSISTGKGQRLILLHVVTTGFLPSCKLLFKSITTDGRDYHTEMNATIFEDVVRKQIDTESFRKVSDNYGQCYIPHKM